MDTKSNELLNKDEKYVWHAMRHYNPDATMVIRKGEGAWVTDINGNKYLDGMSGLWCVNVGYGREELARASYDQMKELPYFPMTQSHVPAIKLGEKLNEWLDDDYVIFFSNSGSEANETAFKMARQFHQQNGEPERQKFISRYRAYHGNSMGALAATGQAERKYRYEPLAPGFLHVTPPDMYRSPYKGTKEEQSIACADEIDRVMTWELDKTVAAVIMEPIITGGGVIMPHDSYLQRVREICDKHGALLIIDEVICGFGRTGKPFGFQNYGVKPDIVTMAKGVTSAYLPLSATAVRREVYESFMGKEPYDNFRHVNTFGGNPTSCAVALKNIEILERENLVERSATMGEKLLNEMSELENHPYVGDVRGKGLLLGIELVENKETKEPASSDKLDQIISFCKQKGLIIAKNGDTVAGYNNILTLSPPLSMTDDDLKFIIKTVKEAFAQI
ncbi:aspartate aminotransferase family protein [Lentibacillus cibarius]|uniref:Aspartate aminotransferase family protein n=1 Tax=Lentibacillus cibarius TaxID=2583219 RepID=A0A549YJJ8_9BACI|nr:aspartate aminotransferase family protein [Lentibacillus cibarius]RYG71131.1 aspartate aminotransferase family protein [Lentibacillus lipolyticus]TRM12058.1 aspartate aminotransferase family protein [Lentibacillus cibarius]